MKVLFLYTRHGAGSEVKDDWKIRKAGEQYQHHQNDCYFSMLEQLVNLRAIDELTVIYESNVDYGKAEFAKGSKGYVIPMLTKEILDSFIDEDTIIFIRGGFKQWHDLLTPYKDKNWLLLYAANTGRERWDWWDIIFDDLGMSNSIDRSGRYWYPFVKPTNEDIFCPIDSGHEPKFDVCIGASNIHDKKGQWKTVQLLEQYSKQYYRDLKAVMPGAIRRSLHTSEMIKSNYYKNYVVTPGNLDRHALAKLFNDCKVFLHLGPGGQNDRSLLEAHSCGIHVGFSSVKRFTPLLIHDHFSTSIFDPKDTMEEWAEQLHNILKNHFNARDTAFEYRVKLNHKFRNRMGSDLVVMPMLFELFKKLGNLKPTLESKMILQNEFSYWKERLIKGEK